jgi:hypothetical protein
MKARTMARARLAISVALVALFVTSSTGCGGSAPAAPSKAPRAPSSGARSRGPMDAKVAASSTADNDSDGIPDQADAVPAAEPMAMRNELAAPAAGAAPAKAPAPPPPPPPQAGGQPQTTDPRKGDASKDAPHTEGTEAPHETSMLIYTARVTMAVYQVDQGLVAVEKIARDNGGYLALKRDKEIVIRVPRIRFEPALAQIDKIGDVLHRDVQAQDVTDEFVDTEIRIKNGRAMQARLKILLDKANVKEALEIEKEMRRVTEELELLEGKLKLLKDKIAYSTITVAFEPRGSTIQATRIKLPFPWLQQLGLPTLLQLSEDR